MPGINNPIRMSQSDIDRLNKAQEGMADLEFELRRIANTSLAEPFKYEENMKKLALMRKQIDDLKIVYG